MINILAMLYPFEQKLEKNFYFFQIKLFFQEMSFHLYFNILHNHPHHTYFKMNVNHLYFLFEENTMKRLNLQTHISL
jgi:hypothetical protein